MRQGGGLVLGGKETRVTENNLVFDTISYILCVVTRVGSLKRSDASVNLVE